MVASVREDLARLRRSATGPLVANTQYADDACGDEEARRRLGHGIRRDELVGDASIE
jgi:hypothetical protein